MKPKKLLAVLLAAMMLLLVGCDGVGSDEEEKAPFDPEQVKAQLQVEGHVIEHVEPMHTPKKSLVLVLKNPSFHGVTVQCKLTTYDADGYVMNIYNDVWKSVGSGMESAIDFREIEYFASYDYELSVSEVRAEDCIVSQLSYDVVESREPNGTKSLVANVSNPTDKRGNNIVGYMLFFKNEKIVGYEWQNFENNFDFAPGASVSCKYGVSVTAGEDKFDSYKFILNGELATW